MAVDVEKELGNFMALRVPEPDCVADGIVRVLPGLSILADAIQQLQFLGEESRNLPEPLPRADMSVPPWEVATGHHEISN